MDKLISALLLFALTAINSSCSAHQQPHAREQSSLFTSAQSYTITLEGRPNDVAVGDWNKDGKLDAVTCNAGNTVTVLLGNGGGGFAPAPGSPINLTAHLVAVGDVNNDGNPDLALSDHDSFGVVVLLGAGDGRFTAAPGSPFIAHQGEKPHNHGLALSHLNSDRNLDITTSNQDDNSVSVLLGDGRGGFAPAQGSPFAVGRAPYPHATGDVNGDGNLDIVTPNVGSNNVTVLLGNGRGSFTAAAGSPYRVENRPYYVALGDVSGDGKPDLMTTHDDINLLTTLLGDGRGAFTAQPNSLFDLGRRAFKLVTTDINRDKRADLVIGTEGSDSVMVLLSDGRGSYTHATGSPYLAGSSPRVAIGDANGDGKPDILMANSGSNSIGVLLGK